MGRFTLTVEELITELNNLPEIHKRLPIVIDSTQHEAHEVTMVTSEVYPHAYLYVGNKKQPCIKIS